MEENLGSSSKHKYLFQDLIPQSKYLSYFDILSVGGPFYCVGIQNEKGEVKNKIDAFYPGKACVFRCFLREADANNAAIAHAVRENLPIKMFKILTVDYQTLFGNLDTMHRAAIERGFPGIVAKVSLEYRGEMVDLDTLWTSDPELML